MSSPSVGPATSTRQAVFGEQKVSFVTKPGIPEWDGPSPASVLLGAEVEVLPGERCLLLGSGPGALGAALAKMYPDAELWLADIHALTLDLARETLALNRVPNACVRAANQLLPEAAGSFDRVAMVLPKGRRLAQRWLLEAWELLQQGGRLYLAGANDEGIQAAGRDAAELFGEAAILKYKKGSRVLRYVKHTLPAEMPGWALQPGARPGSWIELEVETPGRQMHLHSLPGVFSAHGLDEGTRLLLEVLRVEGGERVLDLGCGYGVIGLWAALEGAGAVDLVDVNLLAVEAASKNIETYQLPQIAVYASDGVSAVQDCRYDLLASNPPFHSGKAVDYSITQAFIAGGRDLLEPGGRMVLVANRFIRYEQVMKPLFKRVECLAETGKFQVWKGTR